MLQLPGETEWQDDDELPPEEREALATIGAATQHLAAVMKTSSMPIIRRRFYALVAFAVLAAFVGGGWLAWETHRPLLAATVSGTQVFKCGKMATSSLSWPLGHRRIARPG